MSCYRDSGLLSVMKSWQKPCVLRYTQQDQESENQEHSKKSGLTIG
jgi:hypothetical protein